MLKNAALFVLFVFSLPFILSLMALVLTVLYALAFRLV